MVQTILNTFSSRLLITLFNFLIVVGISRTLGPDGKGKATLIITSIFLVLFFCNVMSGRALIYLVPRYRPSTLLIPAYLWCGLISLAAWGIMLVTPWLDAAYIHHIFLLSLLHGLLHAHLMVLAGKQRIQLHNLLNVMQVVITLAGLAVAIYVFEFRNIFAYIYSLYASFLLTFLMSIPPVFRLWERLSGTKLREAIGESLRFGAHYQLYEIMQLLNFRLGFYMLEHWHGENSLGIYSIGVSLLEAVWLFGRSVALVQYARISNFRDSMPARLLTLRLMKASFFVSVIGVVVLALIPTSVYTFVFGNGFASIKDYMKWLMPGILIYSLALIIANYYAGLGRYRINITGAFLGLICTLLFSFTLIPNFAMSGTGLTATISFTATTLFLLWHFHQHAGLAWQDYLPKVDDLKMIKNEMKKAVRGMRT